MRDLAQRRGHIVIPLSVLDLVPVSTAVGPTAAIHESVALARRVDELGFTRYWLAEHHSLPSIASSAPEVLIAHIAGETRRIRVGAGGMMLPNHAPLHLLEVFKTLEALYPGRIDLGIGRAPGTDPVTSSALRRASSRGGDVNDQLAELAMFARGTFPPGHPFAAIEAMPSDAEVPPLWMLGSTRAGAALAAALGVGFAFAGPVRVGGVRSNRGRGGRPACADDPFAGPRSPSRASPPQRVSRHLHELLPRCRRPRHQPARPCPQP